MSALLIPVESGPNPVQSIVVEECEGYVNLDFRAVTEPDFRHVGLTPAEARALACALLHFASETER